MKPKNSGMTWSCHHDREVEWCYDYAGRCAYIDTQKPEHERAERRRWFQFVKGRLPPELIVAAKAHAKAAKAWAKAWAEAYAKADKAWAKADRAWAKADRARIRYRLILAKYATEITALHREEQPDCPWNGTKLVLLD